MKKMKKIGFDIHGIIDENPILFKDIIDEFRDMNYQIHLLTGSLITNKLVDELKDYDINYDRLFSILGYHRKLGSEMWQDDRGWWIDDTEWNMTKGIYCKNVNMDFHLDDTKIYGKYFDTPFGYLTPTYNIPRDLEIKGFVDTNILDVFNKHKGDYFKFNIN